MKSKAPTMTPSAAAGTTPFARHRPSADAHAPSTLLYPMTTSAAAVDTITTIGCGGVETASVPHRKGEDGSSAETITTTMATAMAIIAVVLVVVDVMLTSPTEDHGGNHLTTMIVIITIAGDDPTAAAAVDETTT